MVLTDPRWLVNKLEYVGPAGLEADLRLSQRPRARALAVVVRQNAHLLGPLDPPGSLAATFASRLPDHTGLDELREQILATITGPHLRGVGPMPDLPHDALLRVLTGHTGAVWALAVAPDGTWLASASDDDTVRIWDPHTGQTRHTLTGHTGAVRALAVAPDGAWLASAGDDQTVRIWDPHTGQTRHTLTGHTGEVRALAVAPDGTWLASASDDQTVRIWDPHTGQTRHTLTGHTSGVRALAVAPDGTWLASAGDDGTVRIWDPHTGQPRHTLTGHTGGVRALAVAPDGSWLASAGDDEHGADLGPAHRADPPHPHRPHRRGAGVGGGPGRHLAGLRRRRRDGADLGPAHRADPPHPHRPHQRGGGVGGGPGRHLAGLRRRTTTTVRIWDPHTGQTRHTLTGHTNAVCGVGGRPGRHLAGLRQLRTADGADLGPAHRADPPHPHRPHRRGAGVGGRPGRHLAGLRRRRRQTVRIWDPHTGQTRHTLTGHTGGVRALAVAPDGTWLASASSDGRRCGSGTRTPGSPATPSPATPARCWRWRSPRTAPGWPPPATTHGADLGPAHRADPPHPHRPHRTGGGVGGRPGRHLAGLRRRRPARCGSGTRTPGRPATPSPATPAR